MRTIWALVLVLSRIALIAQCDYEVNEYDDMKKVRRVTTRAKLSLGLANSATFDFRQVDTLYYITAQYTSSGVIAPDDELIFKLNDEAVVSFRPLDIYVAESHLIGSTITHTLKATYAADRARLELLRSKPVVKFRKYTSNGYTDHDLESKEKMQRRINEAVGCLLDQPGK